MLVSKIQRNNAVKLIFYKIGSNGYMYVFHSDSVCDWSLIGLIRIVSKILEYVEIVK